MTDDLIQAGDVFVREYGKREIVHVILPSSPFSSKRRYMVLNGTSIDSTWSTYRSSYHTFRKSTYTHVGTIPADYLNYLWRNWTLRGLYSDVRTHHPA